MSTWRDNLLPGSWRGVPFHTESADAELGRRVALHEYPLRERPYAEDLGRKARQFTLEVYLLGPGYMAARDALIAAIETAGPGELVHPYLGALGCTLTEARGPRESTREGGMARFSLSFVEAGEAVFPKATADTRQQVSAKADLAAAMIKREFPLATAGRPAFVFDHAKTLVGKLTAQLDTLRKALPGVPAKVTAYVADLQRLAGSLETLIRTPADLAVEIYGRIADLAQLPDRPERALKAYRQLFDAFSAEPAIPRTTPNRRSQADNQQALAELVARAAVVEAVRSASRTTFASSDEAAALRTELADQLDRQMESAADEVYQVLADLRAALVRDLSARGASLARVTRFAPAQTLPALVVAYRLYGDANRAEEIVSRNKVRHPGFVAGGADLEVLTDG